MNDFKELSRLVKKRKEKINALYELLDTKQSHKNIENLIELSGLKKEPSTILAALRNEHPHKTRMQIVRPGANNSTSRDKFSAQAIFSYHAT